MILQMAGVQKSFGAEDVLKDASLQIKNNEKIALVGRNGCGKTTLLKIICGDERADAGERFVQNGVRIGYLSQVTFSNLERTAGEELLSVFAPLKKLEAELAEQAALLAEDHSEKQLEKYDRLQTAFETAGGYDYEHELRSVFFHFGFSETDLDKKLAEFSSGQRTRIALVRLLLEKPDVLLLDEPTNHLDVDSIEWLENYLKHYPKAVVLVSHDRMFLDHVADAIVEIEYGKTTNWPGNYTHYVEAKKQWLEKNAEAYARQQKEIERLEGLIEKFRYKKNKAAFAQSKIKYLDRMERIEKADSDKSRIHARFSAGRRGGDRVLEAEGLQAGYDSVLTTLNLELRRGDRAAVVGPNGQGKSTLIKTLMGKIPAKGGAFRFGHQIDAGYFDQDEAQHFTSDTVLETLWNDHPQSTQTEIRTALASFLFTGEDVFKETSQLSGGERVRLALVRLMMNHDNLLILDEPTNHLDIPAKEALEDALKDYDGTLLFVSHDRMFLKKMADRVIEIGPVAHVYNEGYEEYLADRAAGTLKESAGQKKAEPEKKAAPALDRTQRNQLKNRVARLESLLEEAEQDLESLRELRYEPEYYQDYRKMEELDQQIDDKHNEIAALMEEWETKLSLLEEDS